MAVLRFSNASSRCNDQLIEYLTILRLSWFIAPEDLSQSCDVPSFCKDFDIQLGCPDLSSRKICPSDLMFRILWGSWLPIGSSWFVVPEDLFQWFNVPSFCEDLDFRLGRPDLLSRKICPSDLMFCLFARISISDWVVLILKRNSVSFSATIRSSYVPLCVRLQTTTFSFNYYSHYPVELYYCALSSL